jgi:hypothetical protein
MEQLRERARDVFARSRWAQEDAYYEFVAGIIYEAIKAYDLVPSSPLCKALITFVREMSENEPFFNAPEEVSLPDLTIDQALQYRSNLHRQINFLTNEENALTVWRGLLVDSLTQVLDALPSSLFTDYDEKGALADGAPRMEVALSDLLHEPHVTIENALASLFTQEARTYGVFDAIKEQIDRNLRVASGIDPDDAYSGKKTVGPRDCTEEPVHKVVESYCVSTPFHDLFAAPVPFHIPFPCRFEHTHVLGGSGHGKTQLLQYLIAHDLAKAADDNRSIVVMDSQGDLIRTIAGLECFDPDKHGSLADRLLIVDPMDVEFPASLNMFDWNRGRVETLKPLDRERMLNGTVDLYEYLFGALLGAELTQRQDVIFKYLARLMMEIPNATIQTLRELMENGEKFRPYMEKLPGSARAFFETRFFERSFNETKKQILTRLWGVLSNATFERMFSHERNKVDIFEAMNDGKIVLINTAKELLTHDGAAIFGRFFIALISQAALQRSSLQPHERNPAFVYIDEAQDYFDDKIGNLLNQARKYRVGLVLAHQNLDQLSLSLRSTIMASTTIKLAGGVSAKDARTLAEDMRCDPDFLTGMRKGKEKTEFACFVRNFTPQAVRTSVPLGYMNELPRLGERKYEKLITANRNSYCAPLHEVTRLLEAPTKPPSVATSPKEENRKPARTTTTTSSPAPTGSTQGQGVPPPDAEARPAARPAHVDPDLIEEQSPHVFGKGGKRHKYVQYLTKRIAEELGYRAVIEERILDGAGQIDVALYRNELKVACEISITTSSDHELRNVEKCFAAGFQHVLVIAEDARHIASLRKSIEAEIDEGRKDAITFCAATDLPTVLAQHGHAPVEEKVVRGYKVKVRTSQAHAGDADLRRKAVAQVIAKSLSKSE